MASAEREPITGVWGQSPQRGPRTTGRAPGQGVWGQSPLAEAERKLNFDNTITRLILH